jgi:hypothetical protein
MVGWINQSLQCNVLFVNFSYHKRLGTNLKFLAATADLLKVYSAV